MAGRNAQVARVYAILNLLDGSPQGLTVQEICERVNQRGHEVKARTIYRDLELLASAGFPLFPQEEGGKGAAARWVLERTARVNQYLALAPREIVGLYLARGALAPLRDTPFYADLEQLFQKIEEKLGRKNQEYLTEIGQEIRMEPGPAWGLGLNREVLDTVHQACANDNYLRCTYVSVSSGGESTRKLGPHYLYLAKGALYLVAEDMGDQVVKVFSLARMSKVELSEEFYEGKKSDPDQYFAGSFGVFRGQQEPVDVVIAFSKELAPYVRERGWHASQKIVNKTGGTAELHLHLSITPEFVNWVLGFGAHARVVGPDALKNAVIISAENLLASYGKLGNRAA